MKITVTKPFMPPFEEYQEYLLGIWERGWLTNNGPLLNELELRLKDYLGVEQLVLVCNGTMAIQLAVRALGLGGEIITTAFSHVATTSGLLWEACSPVMVDINPRTLNIDPAKIEAAITEKTTAILATHVFGNPCEVDAIAEVARGHGLKVIYDASHAFGTTFRGRSLLGYGDVSTCSFHATKIFHTIEGGAVVTQDADVGARVSRIRNFGHISATEFGEIGINGKNSEVHAAMGLCNLPYIEAILDRRRRLSERYVDNLSSESLFFQQIAPDTQYNHAYCAVTFETEELTLRALEHLNFNNVHPRRYFFPALSTLPYVRQAAPIAEDVSRRILCLPMYDSLSIEEVDMICRFIVDSIGRRKTA